MQLTKFFEKYMTSFDSKDALKLIAKKVERAKELCHEKDERYIDELATVHHMIEDYFEAKGLDTKNY